MSLKSVSSVIVVFISFCHPAFSQIKGSVEVSPAINHDTSKPLRNIQPLPPEAGHRVTPKYQLPQALAASSPDPVVQTQLGNTTAPPSAFNFDGVGQGFSGPNGTFSVAAAPPDTNGAVGRTQYVQWVNTSFAVFGKATGAPIYGPAAGNTLWSGFGGKCETNNDGDIIAQYDKAAGRWVMSQLAVTGTGGFFQCVAISQTDDATGAWYRYAFSYSQVNDYPKLGVWTDAYYATFNMFQGNSFQGPKACAWDRSKMLAGLSATQVCFQFSNTIGALLPADLDGSNPPAAGSPNYLVTFGSNTLNLYKFHVDFATPTNSKITGPFSMSVAAFSEACGGGTCIPQLGTQQLLDSLGDRLMYRLAYRNYGDHEAVVVNHSVATTGSVGIRWYELRNLSGTPSVYQQGTFAPDSEYRWMGSIGMDNVGNIALGYSISSTSRNPSIRYTVRAPGDPLGQMGTEAQVIGGTGSQTMNLSRWGDYSSISIDPVDDCTFWYTTEYLTSNGSYNWQTRIASFKMNTCTTPVIQVTIQTNPSGLQITVDNVIYTAPQNFSWPSGSSHTIATSTPQGTGSTREVFANWSDGGTASHSVTPTAPTTYTANFTAQYLLTTGVSPSGSGSIATNPSSSDGYYNSGTSVQVSAVANIGFGFSSWRGDLSGTTNPQTLVMSAPKTVTANFTSTSSSGSGLRFVPVTPCRVVDTRNPNGPFGSPIMSANSSRSFAIPAGSCGIPITALAYSLNVTVVPTATLAYLTIWPSGQPQPVVSTLNSDGRIKANAALVPAGTNGAVSVYVTDETQLILDINGYFATPVNASGGLLFYPLPPCRVMDTRLANGPLGGPILPGGMSRTPPVLSSSCGIPSGAIAYSFNMTVVPTGTLNYLTTWPTGIPQPVVSTLNDNNGVVVANAAIVPAGTGGSIDVYATQDTNLVVDVNGYFAAPATDGLQLYSLTPCRVVDTRNPVGPFGGPSLSGERDFNITSGPCPVPPGTQGYSLNATVVPQGPLGYLTLWPAGQPQPRVSTLNSQDGSTVSNAATVATANGSISAYSTNSTDLILDLNGVFAP
jgi:hypothetical protein